MALSAADVIDGKYQITGVLGEGGMGTVYEGIHKKIHRRVAIKVLKAGLNDSNDIVRRFEREAQAAGRIGSEHIVEVYDVGQLSDGQRFMILEYLEGESLADRLKRVGALTPEGLFPIAVQMLDGLDAAHRAGIVHRDLKPANVFLVRDKKGYVDFVKVLDFGISKFRFLDDGEAITTTGNVVGTPHYMAPEQIKAAADVDHRCDVYGAGAVLYRALSGRPPFQGQTIHQVLAQLIIEDARPIGELVPGLDPAAAVIVHRAMARDPAARYPDAAHFAAVVQAWLDERGLGNAGLSSGSLADRSSSLPSFSAGQAAAQPSSPVASNPAMRTWQGADAEALAQTTPLGGEFASLATPSPFQTSSVAASMAGPSKRKVALVLAAGVALLAAVVVVATSGGDGGQAATEPIESTSTAAAALPVEPEPTVSAAVTASASASATGQSAKPTPPARPVVRSRPGKTAAAPPPAPPPAADEPPAADKPPPKPPREIRTDL